MPGMVEQLVTVPASGTWLPVQPDKSRELEPLDAAHVSILDEQIGWKTAC